MAMHQLGDPFGKAIGASRYRDGDRGQDGGRHVQGRRQVAVRHWATSDAAHISWIRPATSCGWLSSMPWPAEGMVKSRARGRNAARAVAIVPVTAGLVPPTAIRTGQSKSASCA